jgi:hypothetical protein
MDLNTIKKTLTLIRKTDHNHAKIISQCRTIPALSIFSTHTLGKGFPDIVIGYNGCNYLFEIKDGNKPKSQTKLTPHEETFHSTWKGQVHIIYNIEDILNIIMK